MTPHRGSVLPTMVPILIAGLATPVLAAEKPPEGLSVAVLPVVAKDERNGPLAEVLADQVVTELRGNHVFTRIVTPAELTLLLGQEQKKRLVDCANDHCALVDNELGGALGITHMVVGNVAVVNRTVAFTLKVLDLRRAVEVATVIRQVPANDEDQLFTVVPSMVPELMNKALGKAPSPTRRTTSSTADPRSVHPATLAVLGAGGMVGGLSLVTAVAGGLAVLTSAVVFTTLHAPLLAARNVPVPTLIKGGGLFYPLKLASLVGAGTGVMMLGSALILAGGGLGVAAMGMGWQETR